MSTPTEIKAEAITLLTLGYSCRDVQGELRQRFPNAQIPHHSTIARWLRKAATVEGKGAKVYWYFVLKRAGEIALHRMDEPEEMSLLDTLKVASRAQEIYLALRRATA